MVPRLGHMGGLRYTPPHPPLEVRRTECERKGSLVRVRNFAPWGEANFGVRSFSTESKCRRGLTKKQKLQTYAGSIERAKHNIP